jgi:hypothetical protein
MAVTVEDFTELKRLRRPQLLTFAAIAGVSKRSAAACRTDDALRLKILRARAEKAEEAWTFGRLLAEQGIDVDQLLAAEIGRRGRDRISVAAQLDSETGFEVTIHIQPKPLERT